MCRVGEGQRLELTDIVPCMANIICHHQGLSRGEDLGNEYDTHALLFLSVHTPDLVHIHRGLAVSVWIPALEVLLGSTHSGRPGVGPASNEERMRGEDDAKAAKRIITFHLFSYCK